MSYHIISIDSVECSLSCKDRPSQQNLPKEGSVRVIFVTRAQWERSFVLRGSPAQEVGPEGLPEQIQL